MTRQAQSATTPTTATRRQTDTSLAWAPCFIERQFPVARTSMESYKERTAKQSQTLTGLGKWWGRKPLVLVRATILGLLMPASDDPVKDREIFLKLMTMDDEGLWRRKDKSIPQARLLEQLSSVPPSLCQRFLDPDAPLDEPRVRRLSGKERGALQRLVFSRMPYSEKLQYCRRPEQIDGPSPEAWQKINAHLGTQAASLPELVEELGRLRFGHRPRVGDSFCGAGSVPFEAARLGCDAYGSDLSPVAALLTWAALNIVGGGEEVARQVQQAQQEIFATVDRQVTEWGIEHNKLGGRADAFLYCAEVRDPESGWMVPLAPSWVIGEKTRTVAKLVPDEANKRYAIEIHEGVSDEEIQTARDSGTVKESRLVPPHAKDKSTPIEVIRRNLRPWENDDLVPRPDDVFQERLYCIRWRLPNLERLLCFEQVLRTGSAKAIDGWTSAKIEAAISSLMQFMTDEERETINSARTAEWVSEARVLLSAFAALADLNADEEETGTDRLEAVRDLGRARKSLPPDVQPIIEVSKKVLSRAYRAPTTADLKREQKVLDLLRERFHEWQDKGYVPSRRIEPGEKTDEPIRTRGWTHWHHLFTPRQLLLNGTLMNCIWSSRCALPVRVASMLGLSRCTDYNARLSRWHPRKIGDKSEQVFSNQALNTLWNYATRGLTATSDTFFVNLKPERLLQNTILKPLDARLTAVPAEIWITDPPYADAINYHELSEFFLAWYEKHLPKLFPDWYTDSKRALAIKADDPKNFRQAMVDCYKRLVERMPENGLQVVMFTHQDAAVWADLTMILWAAGLRVSAAWCIATETESALKQGNYVQGTVLLVCRKRAEEEPVFLDEIAHRVEAEVRR